MNAFYNSRFFRWFLHFTWLNFKHLNNRNLLVFRFNFICAFIRHLFELIDCKTLLNLPEIFFIKVCSVNIRTHNTRWWHKNIWANIKHMYLFSNHHNIIHHLSFFRAFYPRSGSRLPIYMAIIILLSRSKNTSIKLSTIHC